MTVSPRLVCASGSVALIGLVNAVGFASAPERYHLALLLAVIVALITAVQSAGWDPGDLLWALLFSVPPIAALLADGAPSWLIGPLATLLLVAAELNVLSWELRGTSFADTALRRRLLQVGRLGAVGLVASLAVGVVAAAPGLGGTLAVALAAFAVAAIASLLFRRA